MAKSALEVQVQQNTKDIDGIGDTMQEMLKAIQGLRDDMSKRGEQMINMINTQNVMLIRGQTDHEAKDIERFAEIRSNMAYYVGWGMGGAAALSMLIALGDVWIRGIIH